jgi:hypothetical protein
MSRHLIAISTETRSSICEPPSVAPSRLSSTDSHFILFFIENTLRIGLAYYGRNGITDRTWYYPQRDPDILSTLTDHQHLTGTWLRFSHLFFSNWGLHDHCYWTFKLYLRASPKIVAFTSLLPWRFPIIESHPSSSLLPPLMHQFQSPSWRCRVRVYLRDRCYKLALAPSLNWYISSSELPRPLRRTILIAILQSISSHIGTRELHRPPPTSFYLIPMITAILVTHLWPVILRWFCFWYWFWWQRQRIIFIDLTSLLMTPILFRLQTTSK